MILHNTVHGAKAKARALADGLSRIERIEDAMRIFDAAAVVGKLDYHLSGFELGANAKKPSARFFERVQSVFDDLHECLEKLVTVSQHVRKIWLERDLDVDFLIVMLKLAHLHAALQQHAEDDHLLFSGASLREAEKIRYQFARALRVMNDFADQRVLLGGQTLVRPELFRIAHDRVERMVDLMRRARNQLT